MVDVAERKSRVVFVQEVAGSNLGPETGFSDRGRDFTQSLQESSPRSLTGHAVSISERGRVGSRPEPRGIRMTPGADGRSSHVLLARRRAVERLLICASSCLPL